MRVLAVFCAAFASGIFLAQYLLPEAWLLALAAALGLSAFVMLLCGCAERRGRRAKAIFLCALGLSLAFGYNALYARLVKAPNDALIGRCRRPGGF